MNASDLKEVNELIKDLDIARDAYTDFMAMPRSYTTLYIRAECPNQNEDAPPFAKVIARAFSVNSEDAQALVVWNTIEQTLLNRVRLLKERLRQFGVDPDK